LRYVILVLFKKEYQLAVTDWLKSNILSSPAQLIATHDNLTKGLHIHVTHDEAITQ